MSDEPRGNIYCPQCDIPTQVIDTRGSSDNTVRRRRRCSDCNQRFTTYEEVYTRTESSRQRQKRARKLVDQLVEMLGLK